LKSLLKCNSIFRVEESVNKIFKEIEETVGVIHVVIHNIGANVFSHIEETSSRVFRKVWELAALSAFLVGRAAALLMMPRQTGCILFTGATASTRGAAGSINQTVFDR
jgi:NAD(P)-dependent dehydrogenase (short-subunit alcohol dehydrogenase family)